MSYYPEKELREKLLALLKRVDFEGNIVPSEHGYLFVLCKAFKGNRRIKLPGTSHDGLMHREAEKVVYGTLKKNLETKEKLDEKDKVAVMMVGHLEYKFHSMLDHQDTLQFIEGLFQQCRQRPELLSLIHSFKVRIEPPPSDILTKSPDDILPQMVVYPALGKEAGNVVLGGLYGIFSDVDTWDMGVGCHPRYSKAVNPFLSYAQGGGDLKKQVVAFQDAHHLPPDECLLSQGKTHYNLPAQHLDDPAHQHLERLGDVLRETYRIPSFRFKRIAPEPFSKNYPFPHMCLFLDFKRNREDPLGLTSEDKALVLKFSDQVLKPFGIRSIRSVWKSTGDFFLRIGLPGRLSIIQAPSFRKDFLSLLYTKFLEPHESESLIYWMDSQGNSQDMDYSEDQETGVSSQKLKGQKRKADKDSDSSRENESQAKRLRVYTPAYTLTRQNAFIGLEALSAAYKVDPPKDRKTVKAKRTKSKV